MIRNFRTLISFPVKFLILQESTAHFMRIPVHRDSETFPAINSVRTGIRINLSVHQKIIFVILRIKFRKCKCTDISHSVLFCKRNLHRRFSRSLLIKSQRCTDPFRHLHCKIIASRKLICTRHQSQPFFLLYPYTISHLYPPPFTYFLSLINITSLISP